MRELFRILLAFDFSQWLREMVCYFKGHKEASWGILHCSRCGLILWEPEND